ncbi:hypothetical protein IE81DRAFT_84997 [Ceraceosorus guamensis]|uniref:Uncharacterized protein n=1 Tax=Ceraceosorus guamensis TaxID=1522189 RepID=A0A316WG19_9BASI|nr:hypothetical protein IE81DRAFT_84997 [Ceraceosorus guamensis]PWN46155.1 hypothetical protein IE81DRAFT_84997 [Ceraceosorus guamensis]
MLRLPLQWRPSPPLMTLLRASMAMDAAATAMSSFAVPMATESECACTCHLRRTCLFTLMSFLISVSLPLRALFSNVINGETNCVASGGSFTNVEGGFTQVFGSEDDNSQSSGTSTRSSSSPSPSSSSSSSSSSSASPTPSGRSGNGGATIKSSASVIAVGVVLVGAALV